MLQNLEATLYTVTQGSLYDLSDRRQVLQLALVLESFVVFCFSITSFLVSSTANAGFNVVLNSFLNVGYVGGSFFALKSSKQIAIGFLMGVTLVMINLDLMTAVYWGQLSHCTKLSPDQAVNQYSCHNRSTYKAVCAFASMLFVIKTVFFCALVRWRQDLVEDETYHSVLRSSSSGEEISGHEALEYGEHIHHKSFNNLGNNNNDFTDGFDSRNIDESYDKEESFSI